jgi:Putative zinc-finger
MNTEHVEVGAYALGLLEAQDAAAFEAHLATCESCRAEFAELSGMKALLTGVGPVETPDDVTTPAPVIDLLRRRADSGRRRNRRLLAIAAAAAVVAVAGGVAAGLAAAPAHVQEVAVQPSPSTSGQQHSATDAKTGVTGTVGLVTKGWGTWVTLDLADVHGPLDCQLIAVSKTGEIRVVTGWFVKPPGDGVPGHPAHLIVQGGTAIALANLSRLEVVVVHGPTLVTIPV